MSYTKLSILHIISGLDIGNHQGGAERFVLELSRHLDRDLFDVSVCAFWQHDSSAESQWQSVLQNEQIEVFFASQWCSKFNISAYLNGVRVLSDYCKFHSQSIIHSHSPMCTTTNMLLKLTGRAKIAIQTAYTYLEWGQGIVAWLCRHSLTDWIFPVVLDAQVGVSQSMVHQLEHHPGARLLDKQAYLCHLAIDPTKFRLDHQVAELERFSIPPETIRVGSIGRLAREKGYEYLLHAVPMVIKQIPNVVFVILGDGVLHNDLRELSKQLGIEKHVFFVGQQQNVMPLLKSMTLFVLPSLWEGLPTVVLESMACGIPVVATDVPGTQELVRNDETGWLVPSRNPQALANVIIRALQNPALAREIANRAAEWVNTFSIENITLQYSELYRVLAKRSGLHVEE